MNEYESITDDNDDDDPLSNKFEDEIKKDSEYLIKTTIAAPLPKPRNPKTPITIPDPCSDPKHV